MIKNIIFILVTAILLLCIHTLLNADCYTFQENEIQDQQKNYAHICHYQNFNHI